MRYATSSRWSGKDTPTVLAAKAVQVNPVRVAYAAPSKRSDTDMPNMLDVLPSSCNRSWSTPLHRYGMAWTRPTVVLPRQWNKYWDCLRHSIEIELRRHGQPIVCCQSKRNTSKSSRWSGIDMTNCCCCSNSAVKQKLRIVYATPSRWSVTKLLLQPRH